MRPLAIAHKALLLVGAITLVSGLAACASKAPSSGATGAAVTKPAAPRPGAYYKDDGPAASLPADIDRIPDAVARAEPLHRFANRPYNVFGVEYKPMTSLGALRQRGVASWYGRKFHGQKTAIGETYDMFAMTAAHPTAPLPCFARITHSTSGRSVIVRINDRGPFHANRIVDLSYAAAHRLGIAQGGSGEVDLELLLPPFSPAQIPAPADIVSTRVAPPSVVPSEPSPIAVTPTTSATQELFFVQLAAFGNFANAQTFQQRMSIELGSTPRVQQVDSLYRVRLGPFTTRGDAESARDRAQSVLSTRLLISSSLAR